MNKFLKKIISLILGGMILFPSISLAALTTNLVSYWKLDESSGNAADSVTTNTFNNTNTATFSAGQINNGANIETGANRFFQANDVGSLDITSDISVSMWVKRSGTGYLLGKWTTTGNQRSYLWGYGTDGGSEGLFMYTSSDGTSGNSSIAQIPGTFTTGVWHHVVITYKASTNTVEGWVDGVSNGTSSTARTSLFSGSSTLVLGGFNATAQIDASIDEVGIWSRVLTSDEIATLYNTGVGCQYDFTACPAVGTIQNLGDIVLFGDW